MYRGAQVVAAAATLSQQEKNNSADVQMKRASFPVCGVELSGRSLSRCPRRRSLFFADF
jgi:hypothetical protein